MTLSARYDAFGERSDSLVPEAVWRFHKVNDRWPLWDELLDELVEYPSIPSPADALARLEHAIREEEAIPKLAGKGLSFFITLDEDAYDRITRRHMDRAMPRKDREEQF